MCTEKTTDWTFNNNVKSTDQTFNSNRKTTDRTFKNNIKTQNHFSQKHFILHHFKHLQVFSSISVTPDPVLTPTPGLVSAPAPGPVV